jgi:acyl-CoA thioester hydrolase
MKYSRRINYYETDAMKIVHHSNYIRFMEEARLVFMDKMGLPYNTMEKEGIMIPVLGVNCTYKHPARFDDIIEIDVSIKEYTGVKLIIKYEIINKTDDKLVLTGETKHCFTDMDLKPISLKKVRPDMHEIIENARSL